MTGWGQGWLVARREIRERSRTRGFRVSLVLMVVVVVALVALPGLFRSGDTTKTVGVVGTTPLTFTHLLVAQGDAADTGIEVYGFDALPTGQEALRDHQVDVLVVNTRTLQWRDKTDPSLQTLITTAIHVSVVQQRAAAAGIDSATTAELLAPVPVSNTVIGAVAGRSAGDATAAALMTVALMAAIVIYGNLVLTGVVEEKSTRVVEVLLARVPARALLAGKVVGIGLLGFFQLAVTALAAFVASIPADSVDLPAVSAGVLAWVVAWFLLGYALYAMMYGALGSLASRTEDAQNVAGPVSYVMIAGYWASLFAISQDPGGLWSRLLSLFPATAPLAMPGRIALGATTWWEPLVAVALTLAAIAGLVIVAGRVYGNAILHSGATLKLRDVWRASQGSARGATSTPVEKVTQMLSTPQASRILAVAAIVLGVLTSVVIFALTRDVVWSLVPLLLTIGAVRGLRHRAGRHG